MIDVCIYAYIQTPSPKAIRRRRCLAPSRCRRCQAPRPRVTKSYIYIYIYIYIHIHVYTYIYISTYMYVHGAVCFRAARLTRQAPRPRARDSETVRTSWAIVRGDHLSDTACLTRGFLESLVWHYLSNTRFHQKRRRMQRSMMVPVRTKRA